MRSRFASGLGLLVGHADPHHMQLALRVGDGDPGRLECHEIPAEQFSGWFVFAGDETDEYKADPSNFQPVAQASLFDRFRVLDSGLEGPAGTTMVWNDDEAEYRAG